MVGPVRWGTLQGRRVAAPLPLHVRLRGSPLPGMGFGVDSGCSAARSCGSGRPDPTTSPSIELDVEMETELDLRTGLVIGGAVAHTDETFAVHDPGQPSTVVGRAASATTDDSIRAVDAAHKAFGPWSATSGQERARQLTDALSALDADNDERVRLLVRENGKVRSEAAIEMQVFAQRFRLAAGLADLTDAVSSLPPTQTDESLDVASGDVNLPPVRSDVRRLPVGVVTIIVPFNWPLAILAASLPYALVTGNTAIVKPPPTAPLALVRTLEHLARQLPDGVVNVVTGSNEAVSPLIKDRRVGKVVFTGSTSAGRTIMRLAADNLARVTLELGGNDPALVLDDATLDESELRRLVTGSFLTTGQVCMGIKRIYVHRSRFDDLVDGMAQLLDDYRVGHGLADGTTMGPLNSARQRDHVNDLVSDAQQRGAQVQTLGQLHVNHEQADGHYLRPTLVLDPPEDTGIVQQEQFGPALPIVPFDDLDDVVDRTNSSWAGLCASVWSSDDDRAELVARRLRVGTVWINDANAVAEDDRAPFGGFRQSGIGRELGSEGLFETTELQTITFPAR